MAGAAGARRSDAAYGRFLGWSHEAELSFSGCDECDSEQLEEEFDRIRAAPFTLETARYGFANVMVELPHGERPSFLALGPVVDVENRVGTVLPRVKMLRGRLPAPDAPDEVSVGFLAAERFGLRVGDTVDIAAADSARSQLETARLVGIHAAPGEFPSATGAQGSSLLLTRAFARAFPDVVDPTNDGLLVRVRPGTTRQQLDAFIGTLRYGLDSDASSEVTSGIEQTIRLETVALAAFAGIFALAGLVLAAQIFRRLSDAESEERTTLAALGWDRADTLRLGALRGVVIGIIAAGAGAVVAIGLSPLFPVGLGRIADPDVGWHVDTLVLGVGVATTVLAVCTLALVAAARSHSSVEAGTTRRRVAPVRLLGGGRPSTMIGLSFSRLGRTNQGEPKARTSLVSLVIVTAILAATAIVLSSFDYIVRHRELAGATWHAVIIPSAGDQPDVDRSLALVRAVPGVEAASTGGWASSGWGYDGRLIINGEATEGQIFGDGGPIQPAIRRGRAPTRHGEVALGSKVLDALGLDIGDDVTVSARPNGPTIDGQVVGEVVLASPYFISFAPGTGSATVASTFTALGEPVEWTSAVILVRYARGADQLKTFNAVEAALGTTEAFEAADRQGQTGLARIRTVPILLIVGLLALVAAAVAHVLLVSIHRNRRDLAVLRAMGLSNQQAWTSVVVHGSVIAVITGATGLTIGVIVGRITWNWIATDLFVVSRPLAPLVFLGALGAALVALANLAALQPARKVLRAQPADVLRTS